MANIDCEPIHIRYTVKGNKQSTWWRSGSIWFTKKKWIWAKISQRYPNFNSHRTTFTKAFQKVFKSRGMDFIQFKITWKKKYNVKLAKQIHDQNALKIEPETSESQQIDYEIVTDAIKDNVWTKEPAYAYWRCITTSLTMWNPELWLSDDTISDLADMWLDGLNRYGSEKARFFALLAFGTISVLGHMCIMGTSCTSKVCELSRMVIRLCRKKYSNLFLLCCEINLPYWIDQS